MRGVCAAVLAAVATAACVGAVDVNNALTITDAVRDVDVSTQIAVVTTTLTVENTGASAVDHVLLATLADDTPNRAHVEATVDGKDAKVEAVSVAGASAETKFDKVAVRSLAKGASVKIVVTEHYTDILKPHPTEIAQSETQFVVYAGNAYVYSPYKIKRCKTTIKLAQGKLETFTKVAPSESNTKEHTIVYGSYDDVAPYSNQAVRVHYENIAPFLRIHSLKRTIEVSHWGNIAVEEHVQMEHVGARLRGAFSRYDFQRDPRQERQPSVNTFKTLLPASARDVYYRDEIGNISTSHMRQHDDSVELIVRPRFPLFGGWRTNYVIGYNVPSYEYLYSAGSAFKLRMRLLDHVHDNMVVDRVDVDVILPERVRNVQVTPPYKVERAPNSVHKTYLDSAGRQVVHMSKRNAVEKHIADFDIAYDFDRTSMLVEPMMLVGAFAALFVVVIVWVRLDFTIAEDAGDETRAKAQSYVEAIGDLHSQRVNAYHALLGACKTLVDTKDAHAFNAARKKIDAELKTVANKLADAVADVKPISAEVADKMGEVGKLDKTMSEAVTSMATAAEKAAQGKAQKAAYADEERKARARFDDAQEKADHVVYGL